VIKSLSLLTRKPGMTHEQFVRHWLEVHGPLALKVPGIRRYVQSHILEERTRPDIPSSDVEIDGVAELWYDDRESMMRALATPALPLSSPPGWWAPAKARISGVAPLAPPPRADMAAPYSVRRSRGELFAVRRPTYGRRARTRARPAARPRRGSASSPTRR